MTNGAIIKEQEEERQKGKEKGMQRSLRVGQLVSSPIKFDSRD